MTMDELERFKRDINLAEVAAAYGYALDRKESSRSNLIMRHPDGDKIVVATAPDGTGIFFSVHADANGSVIDFVMYRRGVNLGHARKLLRDWVPGASIPIDTQPRLPKPSPVPRDRAALVAQWHSFRPYAGRFLQSRGLTVDTIAAFADRLRLDQRGNTAFRHDDPTGLTGWEAKNPGFHGFAAGGTKALFAGRVGLAADAAPPRIVVAESALDAMSFYQTDPQPGLYLSLGGALSPEQRHLLAAVLTHTPAAEVLVATDNDPQGEDYAALMLTIRPDAIRARSPTGKDWNDAVRPGRGSRGETLEHLAPP